MSRKVLCIAPHPDDESIGCGGTLAQHVALGDEVAVIWLTSGEAAEAPEPGIDVGRLRENEGRCAAEAMGITHLDFWKLQDGRPNLGPSAQMRLQSALENVDVLYVPHLDDGHEDHRNTARFAKSVLGGFSQISCWGYEVWTPITEPDWVNDISDFIEIKLKAIRCHQSQCRLIAFDQAAEGLARYRAQLHCWPGRSHAEAFSLIQACP